jgi:hypothetical protein
MRYKTKTKEAETKIPEIGDIRFRKKFVFFPVKAEDGYTYFLQRVYVREEYCRMTDGYGTWPSWEVQDVIRGA